MEISKKYEDWCKLLDPYNRNYLFLWLAPGGLGDKITFLPAIRQLKKLNPTKKLILYSEPFFDDLWKGCRYINSFLPEDIIRGENSLAISTEDIAIKAWWSFYEHHQNHVVKSAIKYICNTDYTEDIPLEYELDIYNYEIKEVEETQKYLMETAKKKIAVIAPAFTMYSRMWSKEYWIKLTDLLKKENYFVISMGGKCDLEIPNVDLDLRSKIPIRQIPYILNCVDIVFTLSSGMLHLSCVNQHVPIVYISVGQFPPELLAPYRNGKLFHNMLVVNHTCEIKDQCFNQHINEIGINRDIEKFITNWKIETSTDFDTDKNFGLLQKYICWNYCNKVLNKYSCSKNLKPENVFNEFMKWRK